MSKKANKEIGKQIGSWIIEKKLGEGGMGEIYLGRENIIDKLVAIKFLPSTLVNDQEFSIRFKEEAKTQAKLQHSNIAQVVCCVEENEQLFLVMEYLSGGTLADIIDKAKSGIEEKQAIKWIKQVLDALNYAHQNRIIHRDIKPTNIMLDKFGNAKVLDFGIALEMATDRRTRTGVSIGTPHYMSPEQIRTPKNVDHRTDVYSTAIVLYEVLTGKVPFDGGSDFDIKDAQVKQPPPFLRQFNPNISEELEEIVLKGLAKDPNQRYSGCGEFLSAIEKYEQELLVKQAKLTQTPIVTTKNQPKTDSAQDKPTNKTVSSKTSLPELVKQAKENTQVKNSSNNDWIYIFIGVGGFVIFIVWLVYTGINALYKNKQPINESSFFEDLGGVSIEMTKVPEGKFLMGSPTGQGLTDEYPQHEVKVSEFFIGAYEVTQEQWNAIMGTNPSYFQGSNLPVENVSWFEAVEFCKRLSEKTGRKYRLPSEAEWEYACRAGNSAEFAFGDTITSDIVNYDGNYPDGTSLKGISRKKTTPVGNFATKNAFGLYDMHGNVWEWCSDSWHTGYQGAPTDGSIWKNTSSQGMVLRGGSWNSYGRLCRSAYRSWLAPSKSYSFIGFRIVREAK